MPPWSCPGDASVAGGGRSRADHCHMVGVRSGYTALGALGRGAVVLCAEQVGGGGCSGRSPRCRLSRPVWTWRRTYRSLGGRRPCCGVSVWRLRREALSVSAGRLGFARDESAPEDRERIKSRPSRVGGGAVKRTLVPLSVATTKRSWTRAGLSFGSSFLDLPWCGWRWSQFVPGGGSQCWRILRLRASACCHSPGSWSSGVTASSTTG